MKIASSFIALILTACASAPAPKSHGVTFDHTTSIVGIQVGSRIAAMIFIDDQGRHRNIGADECAAQSWCPPMEQAMGNAGKTDLMQFTSACDDPDEAPKDNSMAFPLPHRHEYELTPIAISSADCAGMAIRDNDGLLLACFPAEVSHSDNAPPRSEPHITWLDSPPGP
jgi:hypothetical protein